MICPKCMSYMLDHPDQNLLPGWKRCPLCTYSQDKNGNNAINKGEAGESDRQDTDKKPDEQ